MTVSANDWIAHHARFAPAREAMHDLTSDRHFTYAEMDQRVERAALYLRDSLGVQDNDRVAVLCHNDTDMLEIQFACRRLGSIFLPLNWRLAVPTTPAQGNWFGTPNRRYAFKFAYIGSWGSDCL